MPSSIRFGGVKTLRACRTEQFVRPCGSLRRRYGRAIGRRGNAPSARSLPLSEWLVAARAQCWRDGNQGGRAVRSLAVGPKVTRLTAGADDFSKAGCDSLEGSDLRSPVVLPL